jgi:hypothetical protein
LPILNMLTASGELVHSDINAIVAGPCPDGSWECKRGSSEAPYPLERVGKNNPVYPNRLEPFREFTSIFHDEQTNSQVFPEWYKDPVLGYTLDGVGDAFMINYGSGGIGSEIIANRLHAGPMHDCTDCAYEEFFLASQTVGDPAMLVNFPANTGIEACSPRNIVSPDCWRQFNDPVFGAIGPGPDRVLGTADDEPVDTDGDGVPEVGANPPIPGNYALFQEDPSNVHHAYLGDQTKVRNTHAGAFEQHIFHLHNQQWLFNPNDDNANYLDAQEIMPGSGHTYELVNGGVVAPVTATRLSATRSSIATSTRTLRRACGITFASRTCSSAVRSWLCPAMCRTSMIRIYQTIQGSMVRMEFPETMTIWISNPIRSIPPRGISATASRPPAPARCLTASCPMARRSRLSSRCPARRCRRCRPR